MGLIPSIGIVVRAAKPAVVVPSVTFMYAEMQPGYYDYKRVWMEMTGAPSTAHQIGVVWAEDKDVSYLPVYGTDNASVIYTYPPDGRFFRAYASWLHVNTGSRLNFRAYYLSDGIVTYYPLNTLINTNQPPVFSYAQDQNYELPYEYWIWATLSVSTWNDNYLSFLEAEFYNNTTNELIGTYTQDWSGETQELTIFYYSPNPDSYTVRYYYHRGEGFPRVLITEINFNF